MTTTTNKPSNERKVIAPLDTAQEATVDGVAAAAGIGRAPAGADQEHACAVLVRPDASPASCGPVPVTAAIVTDFVRSSDDFCL
jgi:hypothetical protein